MKDLRALIKTLDDMESKRLIPEIKGCLMELERHRSEAGHPEDPIWNVIDRDDPPMERQVSYLTVEEKASGERSLTEGFLEEGKWYNENGVSLESKGLKAIAWLPRTMPESYQGEEK